MWGRWATASRWGVKKCTTHTPVPTIKVVSGQAQYQLQEHHGIDQNGGLHGFHWKEANEIWLHATNFNRDTGLILEPTYFNQVWPASSNKQKDQQLAAWYIQVKQHRLCDDWPPDSTHCPYWLAHGQGPKVPRASCGYKYNEQSCQSSHIPWWWKQKVPRMLDCKSIFTQLITQEDFTAFSCR
jgi:hypothetical protein